MDSLRCVSHESKSSEPYTIFYHHCVPWNNEYFIESGDKNLTKGSVHESCQNVVVATFEHCKCLWTISRKIIFLRAVFIQYTGAKKILAPFLNNHH